MQLPLMAQVEKKAAMPHGARQPSWRMLQTSHRWTPCRLVSPAPYKDCSYLHDQRRPSESFEGWSALC